MRYTNARRQDNVSKSVFVVWSHRHIGKFVRRQASEGGGSRTNNTEELPALCLLGDFKSVVKESVN